MDEQHELHDLWQSAEWKAVHLRSTQRIVRSGDLVTVFWVLMGAVLVLFGLLAVLHLLDVVPGQCLLLFALIPAGLGVAAVVLVAFLVIHGRTHSRRELEEFARLQREFLARRRQD